MDEGSVNKPGRTETRTASDDPWVGKLLEPIPGERPTGESLRYQGTYDAINEARREDDTRLPQGVWESDLHRADWREVARLCIEALTVRTKDLQIAVWLLEANVHLEGTPGLANGLSFLSELCERYWDDMYPELAPEEPEYRSAPVEWMGRQLGQYLVELPITNLEPQVDRQLTLSDWRQLMSRHAAEGELTVARFISAAGRVSSERYQALARDLRDAAPEAARFEAAMDGRFRASEAPSLQPLREAMTELEQLALRILRERGEETVMSAPEEMNPVTQSDVPAQPGESAAPTAPAQGDAPEGPIHSRQQAYQRLEAAANYLLRTEPHSPTPYLVLRAVSWGKLSLSEVLAELVTDERNLEYIRTSLGLHDFDPGSGMSGETPREVD